jgi:shikimate dehydrogenase
MQSGNHAVYPELWFRPSPFLPFSVLYARIASAELTASLRMGKRDGTHAKGYVPGQRVTLRVFDDGDHEVLTRQIRISAIETLRLSELGCREITTLQLYTNADTLRDELSFFEKRSVREDEDITIVSYTYVSETTMTIQELLEKKLLVPAVKPPHNGDSSSAVITMPLIAEDYPAKTATMWNAAYQAFGMHQQNVMVVADPKDTQLLLKSLRDDARYVGGGAGIGFKEAVMPYLDSVTPLATSIGAVNIIKKENGILVGDNTDGEGYVRSLEELLETQAKILDGASVLMLGAGGSARGIGFALAKRNARITILNRTVEKAEELAESINDYARRPIASGAGREIIASILPLQDVVVSVIDDAKSPLDAYSTLGTMTLPITPESIIENRTSTEKLLKTAKASLIISDIRIRNQKVPMLEQAEELGFRTLDGIGMVINQGAAAFWWLYGEELSKKGTSLHDVERVMREAASA